MLRDLNESQQSFRKDKNTKSMNPYSDNNDLKQDLKITENE